ncbi:extracellular solute-binding protein, partial [candidate division KSB3 bacterium]|nr:extracellular solute-binding protein [candidate division KSB3 bacterium]MBD3324448.1 extracellular solute-binding protein [candidate division KSB3 bacterium]
TLMLASASFAEFNWRKFEGTELRVLLNRHPWQENIEPFVPEFEELTGMKVFVEVYPEDQFRAKRTVEMASGVANIDVTMMIMAQEGRKYKQAGWVIPLEELIANPDATNPDYDVDDFLKGAWEAAQVEGTQVGVPVTMEVHPMLFYRKDLLEEHGIAVPQTMEELEAAAKKLMLDTDNDGKTDIYGIGMRGKRAAATSVWAAFLHSYGGDWLDENREPAIDSPEAIAAFDVYGRLLREAGPPGSTGNHWYEVVSLMSQGKVAFACDASLFFATYEDPEKSQVVGKVGYGVIPEGPAGRVPSTVVWSVFIPYLSQNPEAAWMFIQWATSKEMETRFIKERVPGGRMSPWQDPEVQELYPSDFIKSFQEGAEIASSVWNPPVVAATEIRDVIGAVIVDSILGEDVAASAKKAAEQMKQIMEATEPAE